MHISVEQANALIAIPKQTVSPMRWQTKKGNYNPNRFHFESALMIQNESREDLFLRIQYRGEYQQLKAGISVIRSANISSGLYAANHRIFAYDFDDSKPHTNKIGKEKPYYRQQIIGLHQHIWTTEGYGYAEPITLTNHRLETIIQAFSQSANIHIKGGFVAPPQEQLPLF